MVNTAQAVLFVASPEQADAPVRAGGIDDTTAPSVARNATRSSPSSRSSTGGPSGSATSQESSAGTQYRRIKRPIGVSGPTRVRASFCDAVSMTGLAVALEACVACEVGGEDRSLAHALDVLLLAVKRDLVGHLLDAGGVLGDDLDGPRSAPSDPRTPR